MSVNNRIVFDSVVVNNIVSVYFSNIVKKYYLWFLSTLYFWFWLLSTILSIIIVNNIWPVYCQQYCLWLLSSVLSRTESKDASRPVLPRRQSPGRRKLSHRRQLWWRGPFLIYSLGWDISNSFTSTEFRIIHLCI